MTQDAETAKTEKPFDPFFEQIADGHGNACTGPQGNELHLVEGYLEAASLLADQASNGDVVAKDLLVMPILYNARHGLELSLKFAARELAKLDLVPQISGAANHDIRRYFDHLSAQRVADLEVRGLLLQLQPFAESLAKIDEDGQQFRFFADNNDQRVLAETPVIHIPLVRESVGAVKLLLKGLHRAIDRLSIDQSAATSTRECSRKDLFDITEGIGPHATWTKPGFDERRAAIMERYNLSSNGFSRALNAIKSSRELGAEIGVKAELRYLNADKATRLCELCFEHSPPPAKGAESTLISAADIQLEDLMRPTPGQKIAKAALEEFSVEEIADAQAIFYLARDGVPGDLYESELEAALEEHAGEHQHRRRAYDVLGKLNFAEEFINGLHKVGQPFLSRELADLRESKRKES